MKRFMFFFLSLLALASFAEDVPVQKAHQFATQFLQSAMGSRSSNFSFELVYSGKDAASRSANENAPLYVFNNTQGKGFVIVAGDDAALPILGYSVDNNFNGRNMPSNLRAWLEGYEQEIQYLRKHKVKASSQTVQAWQNISKGPADWVKHLHTASWDQGAPYNAKCPRIDGELAFTGCVITAMAIVMYHHKYPDCGIGELQSYQYQDADQRTHQIDGVKLGHPYDWDSMKPTYTDTESAPSLAELMRDCGVMMQARYEKNGTGALNRIIPYYMIRHMKYAWTANCVIKSEYRNSQWNEILQNEINENRPIIYGGDSSLGINPDDVSEGHAFILEGYTSDGYYGVNWGWSGIGNGPYLLSSLNPEDEKVKLQPMNFNFYQDAVIGLQPNPIKDKLSVLNLIASTKYFKKNEPFKVKGQVGNVGTYLYPNLKLYCMLVNKDLESKEVMDSVSFPQVIYPTDQVEQVFHCKITQPIEKGDQIVLGYYQQSDNKLVFASTEDEKMFSIPVVSAEVQEELSITKLQANTETIKKDAPFEIELGTIHNLGNVNFNGDFLLAVLGSKGQIKEELKKFALKIDKGATHTPTNLSPVACTIHHEIQKGDNIQLLFKNKQSDKWRPIIDNESRQPCEILLFTVDTDLDLISFNYDKIHHIIRFDHVTAIKVTAEGDNSKDLTNMIKSDNDKYILQLEELPDEISFVSFTFEKEGKSKQFFIILPDKRFKY